MPYCSRIGPVKTRLILAHKSSFTEQSPELDKDFAQAKTFTDSSNLLHDHSVSRLSGFSFSSKNPLGMSTRALHSIDICILFRHVCLSNLVVFPSESQNLLQLFRMIPSPPPPLVTLPK